MSINPVSYTHLSQNIKELIDEFDIYLGSNLESSIKKKPISVKAVSYTHLDVYKRQILAY